MKTEDIERLKKICEREGFTFRNNIGSVFHIEKKDPWEGVEFVTTAFKGWKFYKKVSKITSSDVYFLDGNHFDKDYLLPITEQEYFEQLKKEAFERFGDIKHGDFFDLSGLGRAKKCMISIINDIGFTYDKKDDTLYFNHFILYQSGKWATKLPERVEITEYSLTGEALWNVFKFRVKNSHKVFKGGEEIKQFLVDQLEKYLNDEKN